MQLLLARGADSIHMGGQHGSALSAVSIQGHQEIVQLLLERGANVHAKDGYYDSSSYLWRRRGSGAALAAEWRRFQSTEGISWYRFSKLLVGMAT